MAPVDNPLIRKFERLAPLSLEDRELLGKVTKKSYLVGPHQDIIREGEVPDDVHLIVAGMACRHKTIENGARQIVAYLLPGDFCDLHIFILDQMDHTMSTLTECAVVDLPRETVLRVTDRPAIARALWWATLVDEGTLREGLINIGQRRAEERMARFLCEIRSLHPSAVLFSFFRRRNLVQNGKLDRHLRKVIEAITLQSRQND